MTSTLTPKSHARGEAHSGSLGHEGLLRRAVLASSAGPRDNTAEAKMIPKGIIPFGIILVLKDETLKHGTLYEDTLMTSAIVLTTKRLFMIRNT
jgi:hypothetical protein